LRYERGMAAKKKRLGATNLVWTEETEKRARRMAGERRWSLSVLFEEALRQMDEREQTGQRRTA
jgi:hypothetical protein